MTRCEIIGDATLYLGDCRKVLAALPRVGSIITDPPYPNGEGHFEDSIRAAKQVIRGLLFREAMIFWSEISIPPCSLPLTATHIWHRTNVNGKIYEPIFHFAEDGKKRRSELWAHAAVFDGVGPGCAEYTGHPTQKPVGIMRRLVEKAFSSTIVDPFMGSGSTGVASLQLQRRFIGIEKDSAFFDIACRRVEEAWKQPRLFAEPAPPPSQGALGL